MNAPQCYEYVTSMLLLLITFSTVVVFLGFHERFVLGLHFVDAVGQEEYQVDMTF
jgi:hypothetical protein